MKLTIDTERAELSVVENGAERALPLYCREAFELISRQWVVVGWNQRYPYTFSWMGRPVIQLPEDMIRIQEVLYRTRPDVVVETGIAHGGSLIFYASLFRAMNHGRVIGVDVEIRPHNREAIESHELFPLITLVEGDSIAPEIVEKVRGQMREGESVLVLLDSNHTHEHVLAELEAYHALVSPGSYIVATDGVMEWVAGTPRGETGWAQANPSTAARAFLGQHPEFELEQPPWPFNESELDQNVTHWPGAWLRRR